MNMPFSPADEVRSTLELSRVSKTFGGVKAVQDATFSVRSGVVTGLIGPNGAGKSTTVGLLSGFIQPDTGKVLLGGEDVSRLNPVERCLAGLTRTFQQATPFHGLSVMDNVLVGMTNRFMHASREGGATRLRQEAEEILRRFGLAASAEMDAASLPFGSLRFMEIARAIATRPKFLLLDEPAAGLNAQEVGILAGLIRDVAAEGVGVLLIDHDVPFVFRLCETIVVMDAGKTIARGTPQQIEKDPAVKAAYLSVSE